MKIANRHYHQSVKLLLATLLWVVLMGTGLGNAKFTSNAEASTLDMVTNINGEYHCFGECVGKACDGWELNPVVGEKDTITYFPTEAENSFYQVDIESRDGTFHEIEIGSFIGSTLRTATAQVSDDKFPVLEEYLFDNIDVAGHALGFTKIVRNPSKDNFKSCILHCEKMR